MAGRGLQIGIGANVAQLAKDMKAVEAEVLGAARDAEKGWKQTTDKMFADMERRAASARKSMTSALTQPTAPGIGGAASSPATGSLGLPKTDPKAAAELIRQADAVDRLRASMDPLYAASLRYEAAVEQVNAAVKSGAISQDRANDVLAIAESQYKQTAAAARGLDAAEAAVGGLGARMAGLKPQIQNASFQIQDFAVQVAAGGSAATALAQQLPQMLGGFGVWGAVAGAAAAVLLPLAANILMTGEEAETAEDRIDRLRQAVDDYVQAAEAARVPTAELTEQYGSMADAARRALSDQAALARDNALRELAADADALAASLEIVEGLAPSVLGPLAAAGGVRSGQANALSAYEEAIDGIAEKYGISADAAEAFYEAVRRVSTADGPEAQAQAAQEAHDQLRAAAEAAGGINDAAAEALGELNALAIKGAEFVATLEGGPNILKEMEAAANGLTIAASGLGEMFAGWLPALRDAAAALGEMGENMLDARQQYQQSRVAGEFVADQRAGQMARSGDYLGLARSMLGRNENIDKAAIEAYFASGGVDLDPVAQAWCAAFVNATLEQAGLDGTNSNLARSFLNWGREVEGAPQVGDIGVLPRGDNPAQGHVGFVTAVNPNGTVTLLGGNQGNAVSEQTYQASDFLGFRRPDAFGEGAAEDAEEAAREADRAAEAADRARDALGSLQGQLDPAAKAALDFANAQELVDKAIEAGGLSAEEGAGLMAQYQQALDARTAEEQAEKLQEVQGALDGLRGSLDPAIAAQLEMAEATKAVDAAIEAQIITAQEGAAILDGLAVKQIIASEAFQEAADAAKERTAQLEGVAQTISGALGDAFMDAITGAESFGDAMKGAISSILADLARLIIQQTIYNALARAMNIPAGPSLLPLPGGAEGGQFDGGGFTGHGAKHDVAGVVHRGEYVLPASAVRRIGLPRLEMARRGAPVRLGFAEGGYAGGLGSWLGTRGAQSAASPTINVAPAPVENVVLLGDADAARLVARPGVQRNIIRLMEREGFQRG